MGLTGTHSTSTGSYRLGTRLETATIISSEEDASNIEMAIFASMIEVVDVFRWGSTPDESEVTLRRDTVGYVLVLRCIQIFC